MKKILAIMQLPPPVHGQSIMNSYIYNSKKINNTYEIKYIKLHYSNLKNIGLFSFNKLFKMVNYLFITMIKLITFNPEIIYFTISPIGNAFYRDSLFVFLCKLFKKKLVLHLHGKGILNNLTNPIKKLLYKSVFNNTEVICLSKLLIYDVRPIFTGKVHIVSNGIQQVEFKNNQNKTNGKIKLLFLSNLIKSKGIFDYIEALNILKNRGLDFLANIIGKESDLTVSELNQIIDKKKLNDRLVYLGYKYGEEKFELLKNQNIFIHPSLNDAYPLVILEAMEFFLPVISTFEGAIPDIIDNGITGFLVNKNAPGEIANKIELLINDKILQNKMGRAGRKKFLENYTIKKFEEKMIKVFDDIFNRMNGEKNVYK